MRQIQWSKVASTAISKTVWNSLAEKGKDGEERTRREKIDIKELEALFCAVVPSANGAKRAVEVVAAPEKEKEVVLLDAKTSNNLSMILSNLTIPLDIMLGRIKISFPELRIAILNCNETILTETIVKQFLQFIPTKEESNLIQDYLGSSPDEKLVGLGRAEQFYHEMLKIPRYERKLQSVSYRMKFIERIVELRPDISRLQEISTVLIESEKIQKILEVVLAIGNYLNSDSFRGQAHGFSVDILPRLGDVKGAGSKVSLLHYLANLIDKKFPDSILARFLNTLLVKDFLADFSEIEAASRVSMVAIGQEVSELDKGMAGLVKEFELCMNEGDPFAGALGTFIDQSVTILDELKIQLEEMQAKFTECVEFYGEEAKSATPESFLGIFKAFFTNFTNARKDNENEAEQKRKAELRIQRALEKKEQKAADEATAKAKVEGKIDTEGKGVMDDLISSLKTGDAFQRSKTRKRPLKPTR
jgi:hypothetical protein